MIHIVSGFCRSGTSAMMGALIAGGMQAAWSEDRNRLASDHADENYHPNRSGLYEVPLKEYAEPTFPLQYQDKLIKVMSWGLDGLAVNPEGYRVVLMRRDPEEIRQSYEAFIGKPLKMPWFNQYEQRMTRATEMLWNRGDVYGVDVVEYRTLIEKPEDVFHQIAVGWPITPEKAAATIDPDQYRFRKELLTPGI